MIELSLSTIYFNRGEIDFESIGRGGFERVEIICEDILSNDDPSVLPLVLNSVKKANLQVSSVHAFYRGVDISSEDKWLRTKSLREIEKSIITASRLSCNDVIVHLSDKIRENANRKNLLANAFDSLEEAAKTAEKFSVNLLLENLPSDMLMSRPDEIDEAVKRGFKLCFDMGHALMTNIDCLDFCRDYADSIKEIHVHFNDSKSDTHSFFRNADDLNLLKDIMLILKDKARYTLEMKTEKRIDDMLRVFDSFFFMKTADGEKV
ncbi:MAG: TIM barrel protein [bacterium]|nr:TIM barrel protein [bacterium]